jgi:O-antigen/teichoic acid export membrane protein
VSAQDRPADTLAAIEARTAGPKIIRGGAVRGIGYLTSTALTAGAFALLLRHLGVVDFGRFSTVIALVTIASGISEAGLQATGLRLYATTDAAGRHRLLRNILGIRLVVTPLVVAVAVLFAAAASYGETMVVGTLVAGAGVVFVVAAGTLLMPLFADLRYGAITFVEVGRQVVLVGALVALVVAGAGLGPFFVAYAVSGAAMVLLVLPFVERRHVVRPRVRWPEWRPILREAGPLAMALAINVFYLKVLIVMASLLVSDEQVGLFATASRVTEVLVGIPSLAAGIAFPLLAHAGAHDEPRLTYALQRIGEVTLLLAGLFVVALVVAAEPIIDVFGGSEYEDAVPVLRIQAFALLGASMTQAWVLGLVAVEARRALVAVNILALASVAVLGAVLIPPLGANGASAAAVAGETILAIAGLVALVRARRALRPDGGYVPRVALALTAGLLCVLLPTPAAVDGVVGCIAFVAVAWLARAIPVEVVDAFVRRRTGPEAAGT